MVLRPVLGLAAALALTTSASAQMAPATPTAASPAMAAPAAASAAAAYTPIAPAGTILQTLQTAGNFRTLLRILDMAGLSGPALLGRASPITIFAPTDDAFRAMPAAELTALMQPGNTAALQQRFAYHIYNGPLSWATLKDHAGPLASATGKSLYYDGSVTPPTVNNATILQTEVKVSNGGIYVIDKVLSPDYVPPAAPAVAAEPAPAAAAAAPAKKAK
jgi:uncharacterized surface protein with fasciclin (FAS1) repeats